MAAELGALVKVAPSNPANARPYVAFTTAIDSAFDPGKVLYMFQVVEVLFMAQHFLLSAAARSLSPGKVMRMSDLGAENVFLRLRWPQTDGKPVCPTAAARPATIAAGRQTSGAGTARHVTPISR
jgi:hypothetical protein